MRDLHQKKQKPAPRNRLKKENRPPINYRSLFRKGARFVAVVVAVSVGSVLAWQLYGILARATFLRLETVEVNRLNRLSREDVLALAGVRPGDDMLRLRLGRIGEHLTKSPWIEKVRVRRHFPHSLSIEVTERVPQAIMNMGCLYYVDAKGTIFKPLTEGDSLDFPVLTGFTEEDVARDPAGTRSALLGAAELIGILRERRDLALAQVSEIHYDKGFGYTLFTVSGGVPVRLGKSDFGEKLARLDKIYRELQAQLPRLEYIDLDYFDKIVVKKA